MGTERALWPVIDVALDSPAAASVTLRAADQLPHTAVTTLADDHQLWFKRRSASPPRGAGASSTSVSRRAADRSARASPASR
jgi:hypothetical protein